MPLELTASFIDPRILAFAIVIGMMALFAWGRWRYDFVALISLLAAIAVGVVPPERAFTGFSDDIVIIVATALVVSAAIAKSGVVERVARSVGGYLTNTWRQVLGLAGSVTAMSGLVKNIGALTMLMPVAFQLARRTGTSPSSLLMPMSFGALLGGTVTLIGTSPNIIVSRVREQILGEPYRMFDFAPVGGTLAIIGVIFLTFGWRLLPRNRKGAPTMDAAFNLEAYTTEVTVPENSPCVDITIRAFEDLSEGEVEVIAHFRGRRRRYQPAGNVVIKPGDILILQGEPDALERIVALEKLKLVRAKNTGELDAPKDDVGVMEAVITAESELVGYTVNQLKLFDRHGLTLLAVSRRGRRIANRLQKVKLQAGDVLVLQGDLTAMPETLGALHCLPLAERELRIGRSASLVPLAILAAAMVLVAFAIVPVAVGFFGAAVLVLLFRCLSLREAYEAIDWPILIMLGALIPVSDALRTTGGTELIAVWLSEAGGYLPPLGSLALIMAVAMAVTPFLNNAATVLVMAPIAATFAERLNESPDPFLMAVAIGAACDFLTPIGHQCNTLVMGPGGYRFGDYWRLGLPLSLIVLIVGTPLIAFVWPF
ncbi:SLC13 family permease [Methyloligella sp. 2.7D]|uniref:SLC13 family permease n=1 Tax=unclassified Methyloligella TaxID=2625955 RepID=UPI00157D2CFD|nr:SLC13 family permease [Methyloligella sp. GL2]QKP76592.1 SLC13 family permease [Methyloligella sp. GL2]